METVKLSEFDAFTRDDLIKEIEALRIKYKNEFSELVAKGTEEERGRLNNSINEFIDRTKDIVEGDIKEILKVYDLHGRSKVDHVWRLMNISEAYAVMSCFVAEVLKNPVDNKVKYQSTSEFFWNWIRDKK